MGGRKGWSDAARAASIAARRRKAGTSTQRATLAKMLRTYHKTKVRAGRAPSSQFQNYIRTLAPMHTKIRQFRIKTGITRRSYYKHPATHKV